MRGSENPIVSAGVIGLHALFRRGAITPTEAFEAFQARGERLNPSLNAIVHWNTHDAQAAAAASSDRWRERAALSVLDGAPIVVKANLAVRGLPWTGAIAAFADRIAADDSAVVAALRRAGAVILGVANMHEAALGATTDSPLYGPAHNPLRPGYTPGGSSGGSAAAVAAGLAAGAIGTDTMGSVRIPSAYCGVCGFKPSFGRVSRAGMQLLSFTLDHVGVHARYARDLPPMLAAIAGRDPDDPFTTGLGQMAFAPVSAAPPLAGLTLAALSPQACAGASAGVLAAYAAALDRLREAGASVTLAPLEAFDPSAMRRKGLLVAEAEAAALMAEPLAAMPEGFSQGLRTMLQFGAAQPSAKLAAAQWQVAATRAMTARLFQTCDALIAPTAPQTAFDHAVAAPANQADFTVLASFAGLPAVTIPMGAAEEGLPAGLQIIAPFSADRKALVIAEAVESLGLNI